MFCTQTSNATVPLPPNLPCSSANSMLRLRNGDPSCPTTISLADPNPPRARAPGHANGCTARLRARDASSLRLGQQARAHWHGPRPALARLTVSAAAIATARASFASFLFDRPEPNTRSRADNVAGGQLGEGNHMTNENRIEQLKSNVAELQVGRCHHHRHRFVHPVRPAQGRPRPERPDHPPVGGRGDGYRRRGVVVAHRPRALLATLDAPLALRTSSPPR